LTCVKFALVLCCILLVEGQRVQRGFHVQIENLSGGSLLPTALSEVVWAVHSGTNPLFTTGSLASSGLQQLAERGNGTLLIAQLQNSTTAALSFGKVQGTTSNLPGFFGVGAIPIGTSVNFGIRGKPGDKFTFVTQFWESNDNFYSFANDGISLFDSNGQALSGTYDVVLYTAGTKSHEYPGSGFYQAPRQNNNPPNTTAQNVAVDSTSDFPPAKSVIRVTVSATVMFTVHLENIGNGTGLSPPAWAVSLGSNTFFQAGQPASAGLRNLAENGNNTDLINEALAQSDVLFAGSGASKALAPATFVEFQVPGVAGSRLHLAFMYGQSNDRFFATPAAGLPLFTQSGPLSTHDVVGISLWDAGTARNEQPGKGPNQVGNRKGPSTLPNLGEPVKDAIFGNPDGFTYQSTATTVRLAITPVVDAPGYSSPIPSQNVFVSFSFKDMIQP